MLLGLFGGSILLLSRPANRSFCCNPRIFLIPFIFWRYNPIFVIPVPVPSSPHSRHVVYYLVTWLELVRSSLFLCALFNFNGTNEE